MESLVNACPDPIVSLDGGANFWRNDAVDTFHCNACDPAVVQMVSRRLVVVEVVEIPCTMETL